MKISYIGLDLIKSYETLQLTAYRALKTEKYLTIGYGHTGVDVKPGDCISKYGAEQLLKNDVSECEAAVRRLHVARTQGQFDALVSFALNVGIGRLSGSTLLKVIREGGSKSAITREFKRWVYAGGKRLRGLEKRREWEARRFFE